MNRVVNLGAARVQRQAATELPAVCADLENLIAALPGNSPLRGPAGRLLALGYALTQHVNGGPADER